MSNLCLRLFLKDLYSALKVTPIYIFFSIFRQPVTKIVRQTPLPPLFQCCDVLNNDLLYRSSCRISQH